jgi:tight adherence protein B
MTHEEALFLFMIFVSVTLLAWALAVPTLGGDADASRRLRTRVDNVIDSMDNQEGSRLHEDRMHGLSKFERSLEELPALSGLVAIISGAGRDTPAYRVALLCAFLGGIAGVIAWILIESPYAAVAAAAIFSYLPIYKFKGDRDKRLGKFEEQFPDALGALGRMMRAGISFSEALRLVAEDAQEPLASEFLNVYLGLNCGMSLRTTCMLLLQRVPSLSVMTLVTAVLIQQDTGGNLAEITDKIAVVIRGRFKLQRKIKTVTAEARMSAWLLTLMPFIMAGVLSIINPQYIPNMTKDPFGQQLLGAAFVMLIVGILWIRKVIRVRV